MRTEQKANIWFHREVFSQDKYKTNIKFMKEVKIWSEFDYLKVKEIPLSGLFIKIENMFTNLRNSIFITIINEL